MGNVREKAPKFLIPKISGDSCLDPPPLFTAWSNTRVEGGMRINFGNTSDMSKFLKTPTAYFRSPDNGEKAWISTDIHLPPGGGGIL